MAIDKRKMYVCMDRTVKSSSGNQKLLNTIISKLKSLGFDAESLGWGPNTWSSWVHNKGGYKKRNSICVFVCNGIDAGVLEEATYNFGYNKTSEYPHGHDRRWHGSNGYIYEGHNNSLCWAGFYGCADFYTEKGKYYKWLVRAHDDNYSPRSFKGIAYPRKRLEENGIKCAFKPDDYSGEGIAIEIAKQFGYGDNTPTTPTTATTPTVTEQTGANTTENQTVVENQQTFTIDNIVWNKVITCKTNEQGAFAGQLKLPFAGEFNVNVYYAGNSKIAPTEQTITIKNRVGTPYKEPEKQVIVLSTGTNTTTATTPAQGGTTSTLTGRVSPFTQRVAMLRDSSGNPIPDIEHMAVGNIPCEKYSESKTYVLSYNDYKECMDMNSQCMQLHDYHVAQWNMFKSEGKYIVLPRGKWNCIEEAMNFHLVSIKGGSVSGDITIDFPNQLIKVGGSTVKFKNNNVSNVLVSDKQNTDYTCGPTACSMCTQVLKKYYSEQNFQSSIHATPSVGSAPDSHIRALKNRGFTAELVSSRDKYKSWISGRKPCVIHRPNHYICGGAYDSSSNQVLIGNGSFVTAKYGPSPGWNTFSFSLFGSGVKIGLNWEISESKATELKNWYESMGGNWTKPNFKESIRKTGW